MAISTTTFAQRLDKINSGNTRAWTVPGEGLAEIRDERRFLSRAGIKMRQKSTQQKASLMLYAVALISGAASVIGARWLDFRFLDDALAFANEKGVDAASMLSGVPTSFALAVVLSVVVMLILGLRKSAIHVQTAGFLGAFLFEADLVALAPEVYAKFYPESWVVDMVANASLVT